MSSEMRYSDDDLRVIVQDWSESDPDQAVAINLARECLRLRALLARTEAGADGAIGEVIESDAVGHAIRMHRGWAVTLDALRVGTKIYAGSPPTGGEHMALHWIERYAAGIDDEPQIDLIREALTHPQDASGDAEDAARWRHVRQDGLIWRVNMLALAKDDIDILFDAKADAAVDAAMQAKEAK